VQARDAELEEDYERAEGLWWQVIEAAQSTPSDRTMAKQAIARIGGKKQQPNREAAERQRQQELERQQQEQEKAEYENKLRRYEQEFTKAVQTEYPLNQFVADGLKTFQQQLGLKNEDVTRIEQPIREPVEAKYQEELRQQEQAKQQQIKEAEERRKAEEQERQRLAQEKAKQQAERERLQREQRQAEEQERQREAALLKRQEAAAANQPKPPPPPVNQLQSDQDDLSSERFGANYYAKLRDLLAAKDWKAADGETARGMCEVMDKKIYLRAEDIGNFPCQDLRNIDRLWVKYSNGKFGFSVQKEVWQTCSSPTTCNKNWERFGVVVGWRTKGILGMGAWGGAEWVLYRQLTFDLTAPRGHLPRRIMGDWGIWVDGKNALSIERKDSKFEFIIREEKKGLRICVFLFSRPDL